MAQRRQFGRKQLSNALQIPQRTQKRRVNLKSVHEKRPPDKTFRRPISYQIFNHFLHKTEVRFSKSHADFSTRFCTKLVYRGFLTYSGVSPDAFAANSVTADAVPAVFRTGVHIMDVVKMFTKPGEANESLSGGKEETWIFSIQLRDSGF